MGGNAIKKNGSSICGRLSRSSYERVKSYVLSILKPNFTCEIVLELPGKDSYGDIDILCVANQPTNVRDFITKTFEITDASHIVKNGYVASFAFECVKLDIMETQYFQIDLINVGTVEHMEMARFYFSYGDVGSIIGRISNYHGMKFGDEGLWCDVYTTTAYPDKEFDVRNGVGKIMLTNNPKMICDYFGYDYNFWKNEIPKLSTKEETKVIFDWLKSTRFFDPKMFMFLNSDHRARQELRPFYRNFLEYVGVTEVGKADGNDSKEGETGGKERNRQLEAIRYFGKEKDLEKLIKDIEIRKQRQEKFSGSQIIMYFKDLRNIEIKDKEVGEKIVNFKTFCLNKTKLQTWEIFLDTVDKDTVDAFMHEFVQRSNF
jgi:hypothetical protein